MFLNKFSRMLLLLCILVSTDGCSGNSDEVVNLFQVDLEVNGIQAADIKVRGIVSNGYKLFDVKTIFENLPEGYYFPILGNTGFAIQYGKRISFIGLDKDYGFIAFNKTRINPQIILWDDVFYSPVDFIAKALEGSLTLNSSNSMLSVKIPNAPLVPGDIIPQTKPLADALSQDFIVRQGDIGLSNPIDFFNSGYTPDCQANNAGAHYLAIQVPPSPRSEYVAVITPNFFMFNDEAIVFIGYTPPESVYFSYRSYLVNRYYPDLGQRIKVFASLGDTINNYNLAEQQGSSDVYNQFYMIISTGNRYVREVVRQTAVNLGFDPDRIYIDVIPQDIARMGADLQADTFMFLHRCTLVQDPDEEASYFNRPPVEVLRFTPKEAFEADPLYQADLRQRGTGFSENDINPDLSSALDMLREALIQEHGEGKNVNELESYLWLVEGNQAIEEGINVLGETRDTLYTRTDAFNFNEDDLVIVYGVNHHLTGKAVYANVSCYGEEYNGIGGVTNFDSEGTAAIYLPELNRDLTDSLYVWKFARHEFDQYTSIIPDNADLNYDGIDYGDPTFVGFRAYIDRETNVGTILEEIIPDRIMVISNP